MPVFKLGETPLPAGTSLIEASAGTGKTYAVTGLYVRLVAELGIPVREILVVTYTVAATGELRDRIRKRLGLAARYFRRQEEAQGAADSFVAQLRAAFEPAQWPRCAQRLDVAAQWMDEAAIFTIHGWSSRMLKTHAFDSASLFEQSRVEDGERLQLQAVQDYWRKWFYALDLMGDHTTAERLLDTVFARQGQRKPAGTRTREGCFSDVTNITGDGSKASWASCNGWALWAMAEHARLAHDPCPAAFGVCGNQLAHRVSG